MSVHNQLARRVSRDTILVVLTQLPDHSTLEEKLEALSKRYPFSDDDEEGWQAWQKECMAMMGLKPEKLLRDRRFRKPPVDPSQASLF